MADLATVESAFMKADAAGDTESARVLAAEVRRLRNEQKLTVPPTYGERLLGSTMSGLLRGGLPGAITSTAAELSKPSSELLSKAAYSAGGGVTDIAAKVGLPPEIAAGAGLVANVGVETLPMLAGGEFAKLASPSFVSGAKSLMQSAMKPSLKSLRTGEAATAIQTMLDEGVNVTAGGMAKLKSKISELNDQIKEAIASSSALVSKTAVGESLTGTFNKFRMQVNPQSDLNAIESAWERFINHPLLAGKEEMPVQLAQQLKQGTYKQLKGKYGELSSAEDEAQKSLARGLKEQIALRVPEISGLNTTESKLIDALNVTERRVLMDANKNPVGLAWLAHNPATWALFMADRSPLFKSLAARMLNAGAEQIPATAARVGIAGAEMIGQNR